MVFFFISVPPCTNHITTDEEHNSSEDLTEYCNINELFSCGDNQVCVQLNSDDNAGQCQCKQGFDKQDDGVSREIAAKTGWKNEKFTLTWEIFFEDNL